MEPWFTSKFSIDCIDIPYIPTKNLAYYKQKCSSCVADELIADEGEGSNVVLCACERGLDAH